MLRQDLKSQKRQGTVQSLTPSPSAIVCQGMPAERVVQAVALLFGVIYLITGIAYLCFDYWPVTESDFWQLYQVCFYFPWWQSALFKIHNHSLFFPSFFWQADLHFFQGTQHMLFLAGLCLQVICTLLLLLLIWRDSTLDLTGKSLAAMTIVVASFWMGRAAITTSGGFNCITSLALLGAVSTFLLLPRLQLTPHSFWRTFSLIVAWGFLATFSFGSGAAVWPTLLFLGWSLRLSWRSLVLIALAALVAATIYKLLPPPEDQSELWHSLDSTPIFSVASLKHLCRFLGAPVFFSLKAWEGIKITEPLVESSGLLLFIGAVALCLALGVLGTSCFRRNLRGQQIEVLGLALIGFNFCVALLVVISRVKRFQELPADAAAPRYFFWGSLFWAGFLLVLIHHAKRHRWLRNPCIVLVLAFPVLGWQFHREEGLHWRYSRLLATEGATALINGVIDPERLLARRQEQVDALTPQLRLRRLDMFSEGLQDWISHPASELFGGSRLNNPMPGNARIEKIPDGPDQTNAVRIIGFLSSGETSNASTMVILDAQSIVVGIARSFETSNFFNSLLFKNRMPRCPLRGYIRRYDPTNKYSMRSITNNRMSDQKIQIGKSTPAN